MLFRPVQPRREIGGLQWWISVDVEDISGVGVQDGGLGRGKVALEIDSTGNDDSWWVAVWNRLRGGI